MKKTALFFLSFLCLLPLFAQQKKVMVMKIRDEIDPAMKRYVELAFRQAESIQADLVLIDMDTYGGVLTDAKEIVDVVMNYKKPVWVFINSDAASAGALISIACDSIYMSPGASIGAATVVDGSGQKAPDKYQSYMRSIMRSTAEENGRDPKIAEGMVDEDLVIEGIKKQGQIVTFSTTEALEHGYCEAKVESIEDILKRNSMENYTIVTFEPGTADKIIAFFINPFISGILILIILAGIYFEMQTPGMGFAGLAALVALVLYLVPYYLNGLAEYWEVIMLFIGIVLLAAEIFVLPGFGVAGISGIILTTLSLVLIMINNENFDFEFVKMNDILLATAASMGGLVGGVIMLFIAGSKLPDTKFFKRVALTHTQDSSSGYTSSTITESLVGQTGIAQTVLRPSGKVLIGGVQYDAFTRGEFIERGQTIEVVSYEGSTLRVKSI
jgi:membrane-bound serine protease (ClpP class)